MTTEEPSQPPQEEFHALAAAYKKTLYAVQIGGETVNIRVGNHTPSITALLQKYQQTTWALITAHNPHSQLTDTAQNTRQTLALEKAIQQLARPYLSAVNIDPQGNWPDENSFFIIGINQTQAITLGQRFHQNAILFGTLTTQPHLIWLLRP